MNWNCLVVDLSGNNQAEVWNNAQGRFHFPLPVVFTDTADAAAAMLESKPVALLAVITCHFDASLRGILELHHSRNGCLGGFQTVVCNKPGPELSAQVFEYDVDLILPLDSWPKHLAALNEHAHRILSAEDTTELLILELMLALRQSNAGTVKVLLSALADKAGGDYRAVHARGLILETTGQTADAIKAYETARQLNSQFRPAANRLLELYARSGQREDAVKVFDHLEKTNPYDVERKGKLASALADGQDAATAWKYVESGLADDPGNNRVLESKAQLLLNEGRVTEALESMDRMTNIGPLFAARLNDIGIALSQAGRGQEAIALYEKAHELIIEKLKYKISLNSALACRRLKRYTEALHYLDRCQEEFGSSFEKLEKVRIAVKRALNNPDS